MSKRAYTVVCLARHGIGPEVMAEASRALTAVSLQHGFRIDERHVPFGADAFTRFGRSFPLWRHSPEGGCRKSLLLQTTIAVPLAQPLVRSWNEAERAGNPRNASRDVGESRPGSARCPSAT